jgi:YggT family protein
MLYQITSFLLDVVIGLLGGACLLRLYMQHQRVPFGNPVGRLVFALTDWLVLPLRRVLPAAGRWDPASLVGAFLLVLSQYLLLWLLAGAGGGLVMLPVLAIFGLARLVISGLTGLLIVYAILSWVQANSPLTDVMERLCAPLLRPFRRIIPLVGGVDLSPLALLVLLQVLAIVLGNLQAAVLVR